jgi:hypothetical protein
MTRTILAADRRIPLGVHQFTSQLEFFSQCEGTFGGKPVPANSRCVFFQAGAFAFLSWIGPMGQAACAKVAS